MEDRYLFKGKEKDSGKWLEWNAIAGIPHYVTILTDTICQCTGLKDKNGNLIWENDVVEIGEHEDTVNGLYKVIYCENAHCYALKRSVDFHYNFFTFSDLNGFETSSKVIGNIFDNPELLEVEE